MSAVGLRSQLRESVTQRESSELVDAGESRDSRASAGLSLSDEEQLTGRGETQSGNTDYDSEEYEIRQSH